MSRPLPSHESAGRAGRHLLQYLRAVTGTAWSIDSTPLGVAFPVNDSAGLLHAYLCLHDPTEAERCKRIGATVAAVLTHLLAVENDFLAPVEHPVAGTEHHDPAIGDPFAGRMIAHFQPIVDLVDGRVVAVEALARMQSGATILGPGAFLELIDSPAMMLALFDRMLDCSLAFLAEQRLRAPGLSAAVKLEFAGIPEAGLPELIERRLDAWGLPGSALEVEPFGVAQEVDDQRAVNLPDPVDGLTRVHVLDGAALAVCAHGSLAISMENRPIGSTFL